jgi:hypothetical protein
LALLEMAQALMFDLPQVPGWIWLLHVESS